MPRQHRQPTPAASVGSWPMQLHVVLATADSAVATVSEDSRDGPCLPCAVGCCVCVVMLVFASLHLPLHAVVTLLSLWLDMEEARRRQHKDPGKWLNCMYAPCLHTFPAPLWCKLVFPGVLSPL